MRPLQSLDGNKKLILCSLYLLIGIAMIAMSFNLVQEQVSFTERGVLSVARFCYVFQCEL